MLLVAIWIVFFMTTMTGTGTCTANYTEYFRNIVYSRIQLIRLFPESGSILLLFLMHSVLKL